MQNFFFSNHSLLSLLSLISMSTYVARAAAIARHGRRRGQGSEGAGEGVRTYPQGGGSGEAAARRRGAGDCRGDARGATGPRRAGRAAVVEAMRRRGEVQGGDSDARARHGQRGADEGRTGVGQPAGVRRPPRAVFRSFGRQGRGNGLSTCPGASVPVVANNRDECPIRPGCLQKPGLMPYFQEKFIFSKFPARFKF